MAVRQSGAAARASDGVPARVGLDVDPQLLRLMLQVRNDLAHARRVHDEVLTKVELYARSVAREAMRRELIAKGFTFGTRQPDVTPKTAFISRTAIALAAPTACRACVGRSRNAGCRVHSCRAEESRPRSPLQIQTSGRRRGRTAWQTALAYSLLRRVVGSPARGAVAVDWMTP